MYDTSRDTSPLERLKQLGSEVKHASTEGEISQTSLQVTDKAYRSPDDGKGVKLQDPTPNDYDPDLIATGWYPKERCEKTIWQHPDTGFYYSEEIARCAPEENLRSSPGRNGTLKEARDG